MDFCLQGYIDHVVLVEADVGGDPNTSIVQL